MPTTNTISVGEVTTETPDGSGVFDVLMRSVKAHLESEFNAGRIKGTDYATLYTRAIELTLTQAMGYSLSKAKLPYELEILEAEKNKILKSIEATTQEMSIASDKAPLELEALQATIDMSAVEKSVKEYQLSNVLPTELANMVKQGTILENQVTQMQAQTSNITAEGQNIVKQGTLMDKQVEQSTASIAQTEAQTGRILYEVSDLLPAQLAQQRAQTEMMQYDLEFLKPQELRLSNAQIDVATQEIALKRAQVDLAQAEVTQRLPVELDNLRAQAALTTEQTTKVGTDIKLVEAETKSVDCKRDLELQVLETNVNKGAAELAVTVKQGANIDAQTLKVKADTKQLSYELANLAPLQVAKLRAEVDLTPLQAQIVQGQIDKLIAENAMLPLQATILEAQTDKLVAETAILPKQAAMVDAQIDKIQAEISLFPKQLQLLEQQVASQLSQAELYRLKAITEQAQTDGSVIRTGSVLQNQVALYAAQAKSYDQVAKREAAKVMIDTFLARLVQDPEGNAENSSNRLTDSDIGSAVQKMLSSTT